MLILAGPAAGSPCPRGCDCESEDCTVWRAGPDGVFVDESERPLFLPYIDDYLRSVQGKLLQWNARSLDQVFSLSQLYLT